MQKVTMPGIRIAGLMLMAFALAHCGDSDVNIIVQEPIGAGTFEGSTDQGERIVIEVGSIRAIRFGCGDEEIEESFSPAKPVDANGEFDVKFFDAGREFRVRGQFSGNDAVNGRIEDEEDECDTGFDAVRVGGPTRTATVTPAGGTPTGRTPTPTATPAVSETPTGSTPTGPTPTDTTPTVTVSGTSPTTATTPCPEQLTLEGQGEQADLDTGFTGIAYDQKVIGKGTLTVGLDCGDRLPGQCGDCTVSGPIASTTVVNNQRCSNDTSKTCTANADCGSGTCAFFFGAPLPLSSGGVPACIVNRVSGSITGTANPDTGAGAATLSLVSTVFLGIDVAQPCPRCTGSGFNQKGTCDAGSSAAGYAQQGKACTVHGTSALFGNTSFDCPPNPGADSGNLNIALNPTTGTSTIGPTSTCTQTPFAGKACLCPGQLVANQCASGACPADSNGDGVCEDGQPNTTCSKEPFRSCNVDEDCNPPPAGNCNDCKSGQTCKFALPGCLGAADGTKTTGSVRRTGTPNKTSPVLASTFCVGATRAPAINAAAGLPGPGALRLPSKTCYAKTCSF